MTHDLTRRRFLASSATASAGLALGTGLIRPAQAAESIKAAWVYLSTVGDHGWTYRHDVGRLAVIEALGDKVETSFVENVAEGPDAERVIRQLAASGNDIIFTTSFGYMNPTVRVAKRFSKVRFEHATGYQTAANLAVYNARFYEGRAIIGTIAGMMTKTGKLSYIASFPIPEVVMGINAYTLAARRIRPDIEVKVVWINSWYDPGKEADAAKAMIDQGVDIISQHTDSPAALQVAEERGVYAFGQSSDMREFAPKAQLTAIVDDWNPYYIERCQAMLDGTWESHNVWLGLKEGMVLMAPYNEIIPADVVQAADAVKAGIIDGSVHPFAGPITNQAGEQVVAEGETLDDAALLSMDWYVDGVQA